MIALTRQQRDVLREELVLSLSGIDDLHRMFEHGRSSEHLLETRSRYADTLWLADDLGWTLDDPRDTFYVTLPPHRFGRWLRENVEWARSALDDASNTLRSSDTTLAGDYYCTSGVATVTEIRDDARRLADDALDVLTVSSDLLNAAMRA